MATSIDTPRREMASSESLTELSQQDRKLIRQYRLKVEVLVDRVVGVARGYHSGCMILGRGGIGKSWNVIRADEQRVRQACLDVYGSDGSVSDLVDVRLTLACSFNSSEHGLSLCGREIARIFGRDSGARLGDGVVLLEGSMDSGGSRANPRLIIEEGTVVEVRDVPRIKAEEEQPEGVEVEIIDGRVDREGLLRERERLLARVAEMDLRLGRNAQQPKPHRPRERVIQLDD